MLFFFKKKNRKHNFFHFRETCASRGVSPDMRRHGVHEAEAPIDAFVRAQRASRVVPFDEGARVWAAVHAGAVGSRDVNHRFELSPARQAPLPPPPPPLASAQRQAVLPYQLQVPPMVRRPPLADVSVDVFAKELRQLEGDNKALTRHVALQNKIISGLSELCSFRAR